MLLFALVPGLVIIDLVNGLVASPEPFAGGFTATVQLSPGTAFRGLLTALAVVLVVRTRAPRLRQLQWSFVLLAVCGVMGPMLGYLREGGIRFLVSDVVSLSRILYAPGMVLLFALLFRRTGLTLEDVLAAIAYTGVAASCSLLLSRLFNIGLPTYEWQQTGFKGLFIAQNELGLMLGISLFATVQLLLSTGRTRYLVATMVTIPGMLLLGTRAAALGAFLAPLGVLAVNARRFIVQHHRTRTLVLAAVACLGLIAGGILEYRTLSEERFQQERFLALSTRQALFVRGVLVLGAWRYIADRSVGANVLGEGSVRYESGVARTLQLSVIGKTAEVDWLDLWGPFGAVFTAVVYGFYLRFGWRMQRLGPIYGWPIRWTALMMLTWLLAHSAIAGHAFGPLPAGTLAPLLGYIWLLPEGHVEEKVKAYGRSTDIAARR